MTVEIASGSLDDLEAISEIYAHYVRTSAISFDVEVPSAAWRRRPRAAYAPSVETSVYVAPSHIGKGLGSALYGALVADLEREDVHRAYAGIAMPNPASVRLHERHGYRRAGYYSEQGRKFGRYWDVAWYERSFPEVASTTSG